MTGSARGRPVRRTAASKMAVVAVCLFGVAGLVWAVLPASEAGGYGAGWPMASGGDGDAATAESKATAGSPVGGTMTMYMEGAGRQDAGDVGGAGAEEMARVIARNWLDGTITDEEYFGAMSYLYERGYMEVVAGVAGIDGMFDAARGGVGGGMMDGPVGSAQGWCKDGLEMRTNVITGDMVCVPDGYADGEDGMRWIEPRAGPVGTADGSRGGDKYGSGSGVAAEPAWQWRPSQDGGPHFGGNDAGTYTLGLKERIADLEEINEGLMRTVAKLQEALMEIHLEGSGRDDGTSTAGGGTGTGDGGQVGQREEGTAPAVPQDGDACLHGTGATFTSVIDPVTLSETDGSLGTIPLPDGRYAVLLMAASSVPVSVGLQLVGDGGLEYDRTFILADTGRPPSEDATMWDYNSGVSELTVAEPQLVNATATVQGGNGLPVFAALARCR